MHFDKLFYRLDSFVFVYFWMFTQNIFLLNGLFKIKRNKKSIKYVKKIDKKNRPVLHGRFIF